MFAFGSSRDMFPHPPENAGKCFEVIMAGWIMYFVQALLPNFCDKEKL